MSECIKLIILFKEHIIRSSNVNNKSNVISQAWCGIKNWINVLRALHQCYGYNKKMISHQNNKRPQKWVMSAYIPLRYSWNNTLNEKTLLDIAFGFRYTL